MSGLKVWDSVWADTERESEERAYRQACFDLANAAACLEAAAEGFEAAGAQWLADLVGTLADQAQAAIPTEEAE